VLAAQAANLPVQTSIGETQGSRDFHIIGQSVHASTARPVAGKPLFGIDVSVPACATPSSKVPRVRRQSRERKSRRPQGLPGVRQAFVVKGGAPLDDYSTVSPSSRTVVQANKALEQLAATWDEGATAKQGSDGFARAAAELAQQPPGKSVRFDGDVESAFARAANIVQPPTPIRFSRTRRSNHRTAPWRCALARWKSGRRPRHAEWARAGRANLGVPEADITIHMTRCGGGFGRRLNNDYMAEAAWIAREAGVPIKLFGSSAGSATRLLPPAGFHNFKADWIAPPAGRIRDHFVSFAP